MNKPRLLIPLSLQFSVRYLLRTELLSSLSRTTQPVVMLAWQDNALVEELHSLGCEVHPMPKAEWGPEYERARGLMNIIFKARMNSPSAAIRERRANLERTTMQRWRSSAKSAIARVRTSIPGSISRASNRERALFERDSNFRAVDKLIGSLHLDAAFSITPFLYDEEMALRACSLREVPTIASILSYDNLTTRSWIPIPFRQYLLWNSHNRAQLFRGYPEAREAHLVGSPQFDFYYDQSYLWPEEEWRRELRIPPDRRVLLFAGGYFTCAPHEPQFLGHLDDAIEQGSLPRDLCILFRKHPVDPIDRWQDVLKNARHVIYDEPWQVQGKVLGHTNVSRRDIEKLYSTLRYCAVHASVASTMAVDGSIVDRPQIGPAYDESPSRKYHQAAYECYLQEHNLPILETNGVAIARSKPDLILTVSEALESPAARAGARRAIVSEICTYPDGHCTRRVLRAVQEFLGQNVEPLAAPIATTYVPA